MKEEKRGFVLLFEILTECFVCFLSFTVCIIYWLVIYLLIKLSWDIILGVISCNMNF